MLQILSFGGCYTSTRKTLIHVWASYGFNNTRPVDSLS